MRRISRILTGLLSFCLMASLWGADVYAAEEQRYTYQVTFYTGNHGTFTGGGHVNVDNGKTGSSYQVHVGGSSIVVSGLEIGDRVNFDAAMDGAVSLGADSKYYVKGIRLSGRDNDTVGMSSFEVKGDQEYVVAYGIRGNMTSYVVNYQDTNGNPLAASRTYYGNVGDRPVIAFLYMEGYEPQAYNLTRTLSANAAENVFTFTYARVTAGGGGGGGTGGGGAAEGEAPAAPAPAPEGGAEAPAAPAAPGGVAAAVPAPAGGAAAPAGGGAAPGGGAADAGVAAPDEEVPQAEGPQELQELDDEEVPLAGGGEEENAGANGIFGAVAIGGVAAIALIAILILWLKRRKKDKEEENDSDKE